jgi:hypothetical protein
MGGNDVGRVARPQGKMVNKNPAVALLRHLLLLSTMRTIPGKGGVTVPDSPNGISDRALAVK